MLVILPADSLQLPVRGDVLLAQSAGDAMLERLLAFPGAVWNFLLELPDLLGPLLLRPGFIAVFLLFTLLMWIGMSEDEDASIAGSFLKAGFIAFVAVVLLFSIFEA